MIVHHSTFHTSANSYGFRGRQCVVYSERDAESNRDINCKHTSMCTHYDSKYHNKIGVKGMRLRENKQKKCILGCILNCLSCNSFLLNAGNWISRTRDATYIRSPYTVSLICTISASYGGLHLPPNLFKVAYR